MTPNPAQSRAAKLASLLSAMDDDELIQAVGYGFWLVQYRLHGAPCWLRIVGAAADFQRVQRETEPRSVAEDRTGQSRSG